MPVLLRKREDPTLHGAGDKTTKASTPATQSRTTMGSREKATSDNNAKVKRAEQKDEPAAKTTTTTRATSSSSSSSSSSRASRGATPTATTTTAKKVEKPEVPEPAAAAATRRTVRTPPSGGLGSTKATATPPAPTTLDKQPAKAATTAPPMPSQTLHKHKQAPVWATGKKKHKSNFGAVYDSGSIPCRINHGSIKNAVQWTKPPASLDFSPLLVTCVEGFVETEHPFVFLARMMFRELLQVDDAQEKTLRVLPQVIPPLRVALMSSDDDVFLMALEATRILSDTVEEEMNTYLPKLTQQIHRKLLTKQLRQPVEETLATLERNGGKEALAIIRNKIPTYVSLH